jgi:hypothetical protein
MLLTGGVRVAEIFLGIAVFDIMLFKLLHGMDKSSIAAFRRAVNA